MDALLKDLRLGLRALRRSPGYTTVVLATLAVGIALNTVVFSVINPYFIRPLPYQEPNRVVHLGGMDRLSGWDMGRFSAPQLEDYREQSRAFRDLAGYYYGTVNLSGDQAAEQATATWGTGNLFPLLGAEVALGRVLGEADDVEGGPDVALLGQGLWTRRFGSDPAIVGNTIRVDGIPHTIVGVLQADFNFPFNAVELWLPMRVDPAQADRAHMGTLLIGRLNDGWGRGAAREEINGVHRRLTELYPESDGRYEGITLKPLREALNFAWEILGPAFLLLLVGVGFVLVIACVNVASLTLARAGTKTREVAVRSALGAGRRQLVRQFLVESLLLAVGGGVLGVALAHSATGLLNGLIPADLYRVGDISVDGRVLLFTAVLTLATPFVFGLAPAFSSTKTGLATALKEGSLGAGSGRKTLRSRRVLVVAEVTLAVVLVTGTGLMARSLSTALSTDVGFPAEEILVAEVDPPDVTYPDGLALDAQFNVMAEALTALPGVAEVGSVSNLPLNHETIPVRYAPPSGVDMPLADRPSALTSRAGPRYFEAMGIPLLAGRTFRPEDGGAEEGGILVSQALAQRLWPGETALGRTLIFGRDEAGTSGTVLGVVGDVYYEDLVGQPRPHIYRPLVGTGSRRRFLVMSMAPGVRPQGMVERVREALRPVDPDLPVGLRPMVEIVRESTGLWAISSMFLGVFGAVALALAALGIYGVISFSVVQRQKEIGLRLALGASAPRLQRRILSEGLRLTAMGLALGIVLAAGTGVLLSSLLLGVRPLDPVTLAASLGIFAVVAALSSALPARRAASIDPARIMRAE